MKLNHLFPQVPAVWLGVISVFAASQPLMAQPVPPVFDDEPPRIYRRDDRPRPPFLSRDRDCFSSRNRPPFLERDCFPDRDRPPFVGRDRDRDRYSDRDRPPFVDRDRGRYSDRDRPPFFDHN
jgi:hypothetical protein